MLGVRKLTPTSYAILGLLGLRSWSAYELTKQGRRSLHFCWPRAETRIYQEPKNLVEHGLVKATSTANGRRARTEYAITAKGRRALRAWMGEPSAPPRLESEALLRLFFDVPDSTLAAAGPRPRPPEDPYAVAQWVVR